MRIELNHGPEQVPEANRSQNGAADSSAAGNTLGKALGEDQAQLSGAHLQAQALAAQASQLPEVREERVHALRQAIQSGHYDASPEKVARALITHMFAGSAA